MRRLLTLIPVLAVLSGCASANITPAQQAWMAKRDQQPLNFVVPAADAGAAWARAQEWIARFCQLPILTSNENVIQTQQPEYPAAEVGMKAIRSRLPNGDYQFHIDALSTNVFSRPQMMRMAQACGYYVASGIPYPG
jgi:hypothetical protein